MPSTSPQPKAQGHRIAPAEVVRGRPARRLVLQTLWGSGRPFLAHHPREGRDTRSRRPEGQWGVEPHLEPSARPSALQRDEGMRSAATLTSIDAGRDDGRRHPTDTLRGPTRPDQEEVQDRLGLLDGASPTLLRHPSTGDADLRMALWPPIQPTHRRPVHGATWAVRAPVRVPRVAPSVPLPWLCGEVPGRRGSSSAQASPRWRMVPRVGAAPHRAPS